MTAAKPRVKNTEKKVPGDMKTPTISGSPGSGKHKKWTDKASVAKENKDSPRYDGLTKDIQDMVQSLNLPAISAKAAFSENDGTGKKKSKSRKGNNKTEKIEKDVQKSAHVDRQTKPLPKTSRLDRPNKAKPLHQSHELPLKKELTLSHTRSSKYPSKGRFLVEPSPQWYLSAPALTPIASLPTPSPELLSSLSEKAFALLDAESAEALSNPTAVASGTSDSRFLSQILTSGTLSDRLSALTLIAQASPLHNQKALESLRNMANKKARDESLKALRAIVDWWVGGGSPDRKLKYFRDQLLTHPDVTDRHLVLWAFEDWLKKYFFTILQQLESLSLDPLPYVRTQTLTFLYTLLKEKPEQEQNLLRVLVNKLGDTEKSVSSKVSYLLLQILQTHPSMKAVIVREVTGLVLRPRISTGDNSATSSSNDHARYYGVLTFTQITLTPSEKDVAELLVTVYFELFTTILQSGSFDKSKDDNESSGTAVKAKADIKDVDAKKLLGRKSKKFTKTSRSNSREKSKEFGFTEVEDGDSKMISAILTGINRALPFSRAEDSVFDNHIETLFRITHKATFNVSIQALVLILQVANSRKSILDRFYRTLYDSILDPRLCESSKQAMYLNLVFKAVKLDSNLPRVCAFVKRLLQALGMHQPGFICGALFLLGELFSITPGLRQQMSKIGISGDESGLIEGDKARSSQETVYDPKKRDPLFARADAEPFWELIPLMSHFHPSVSLHADQLLKGETITTTADLSLNSTSAFLDRFVYKNPKKVKPRGASAMQPGSSAANDGTTVFRVLKGGEETGTVNEETFWNKDVNEVPVDQLFFHKFFALKKGAEHAMAEKRSKRKEEKEKRSTVGSESDRELSQGSGSDDEEEAEIWKAMKRSMPGPKADDDLTGDDDSIPEGLDDSEDESVGGGTMSSIDEEDEELPFDMDEDDEDLMDLPGGLIGFEDDENDEASETSEIEEEWDGVAGGTKRKLSKPGEGKERKRQKMSKLPTFASADDYAKLIDADPEDNI